MNQFTHASLFSGIGGFDLAAQWMGWNNLFHCEWNPFCQQVLKYHFPESISYENIKTTDFTIHRGKVNILTGGFPCQPYSLAGKRKGKEDDRHLWPEMLRAIREIQPEWVVGENVFGIVNWNGGLVFNEVQTDLENEGYSVQPFVLPAAGVNAPHRRDRVWFIAFKNTGRNGCANGEHGESGNIGNIGKFSTGSKKRNPKHSVGKYDAAESGIERCNNRSNNRKERPVSFNKWFASQVKSKWKGWKCGIGEISSNADYSDCDGFNRCNSKYEINASKGRFNALNDIESIRFASDSQTTKLSNSGNSWTRRNGTSGMGDVEYAANTHIELSKRGSNKNRSQKTVGYTCTSFCRNAWQNFPTQSPICGRNDGIPNQLDNITFPKWRNESIKAYGNAIVPQVALQIFKAIEQYNNLKK